MICVMMLVGARDFLLDDFDLLRRAGLAVTQRALQREGGVVDDGERIFDLMRELGGEPAGGAQLAFARGEFARLLGRLPLPFQQHLHAVAQPQPQHELLPPLALRNQTRVAWFHPDCWPDWKRPAPPPARSRG